MANATTALVGQGSSHLFQNAAGFDIVGGQFVLGDVHNHAGPGPVPTSIPLDTSTEALSDSEIYYRQMLYQKRGFPLYVPGPKINLPAAYRRRGVAIGDVGRVTPEGVFDFFFNIFLAPGDPIHVNHTPEDFSPLALYDPIDLLHESYDPGDSVSSSTVQRLDIEAPSNVFPGGQFVFRCDGPQGAVLALPDGADLQRLENLENMRAYAAEHADSWYKYINGARGRGISNGDLYLVTGCEKARSWGMASFRAAREEFRLSFKPTAIAGATHNPYRWSGTHGQANPSRRKFHDPPSTNDPVNQTTFIHGLSISLPTGLWGRLFGTVQTSSLVDFRSLLNAPGSSSASGRQDSLFSWAFNLLSGRGATGGKQHAEARREATLSDLSPTAMVFNPAKFLNEYIAYKAPQATGVVMSHDDDWCRVLDNDSDPSPSDFFRRIDDRFTITEKDGATFLVPNSKLEQPGSFQTHTGPAPTVLESPPSEISNKVPGAMYDFSGSGDELAFRGGDMMVAVDEILDGWWMDEAAAVSPSYTDVGPDALRLPEDVLMFSLLGTSPSTSGSMSGHVPSSGAQRRSSYTVSGKGSRLPTPVACNSCLARKIGCTGGRPCSSCRRRSVTCTYGQRKAARRVSASKDSARSTSPPSSAVLLAPHSADYEHGEVHQRLLQSLFPEIEASGAIAHSSPHEIEGIRLARTTIGTMHEPIVCSVLCMCDYHSTDTDHLEFRKNEILDVVEQEDDGWWAAMRRGGNFIGWIPREFVNPLSEEMADKLRDVREELRVYEYDAEQLHNATRTKPRLYQYDDEDDEDDEHDDKQLHKAVPPVRRLTSFGEKLKKRIDSVTSTEGGEEHDRGGQEEEDTDRDIVV